MMKKVLSFEEFQKKEISTQKGKLEKIDFYEKYYRNLSPEGFNVSAEGESIIIKLK